MTLLDRYLFKEVLYPFIFGLAAFTSIFTGSSIIPFITKAVSKGFLFKDIVVLILYKIPPIISIILPMAVLLSVILAFSRLSSDREIMAFRSMGVGFNRLLIPIIVFGVALSCINFILNEMIVPKAAHNATVMYKNLSGSQPKVQKNINITEYDPAGFPERILNVREVSGFEMKDVAVAEYESGRLMRLIRADFGTWQRTGGWQLKKGVMHSFNKDDYVRVMVIEFDEEIIDIDINLANVQGRQKSRDEMSATELKQSIQFKEKTGQDVVSDKIHYYMKFSLPLACLLFAVLGACVGIRPHRSSSAMGFGVSLLIIVSYYILYSLSLMLGVVQFLNPMLVAWIPNLFVAISILFLLKRVAYQG